MRLSTLRTNINYFAILTYLVLFLLINYIKPGFLYNKDGSIRSFGLGHNRKTIIPIWLVSIILAILCYTLILYILTIPRLQY